MGLVPGKVLNDSGTALSKEGNKVPHVEGTPQLAEMWHKGWQFQTAPFQSVFCAFNQ